MKLHIKLHENCDSSLMLGLRKSRVRSSLGSQRKFWHFATERVNKSTCSRNTNAYVSSNSCLRIRRNLDRYLEAATRPIFGSFGEALGDFTQSP